MNNKKVLITGAHGQLGLALQKHFTDAECVDLDTFNISDPKAYEGRNWADYGLILNAAAYTNVDGAETPEGRVISWQANARAIGLLSKVCITNNITLVHISSDYVFDGTKAPHSEDEPFSPLGVYAQTKAAGDIAASLSPKHYLVRTSAVVGKGKNFVKTMRELALKGIKPNVVNDQIGRLTFAEDLAAGIYHLVSTNKPFGTYNLTNDGESVSWADIAKIVYEHAGASSNDVTGISTAEYYGSKEGISPRPLKSELNLAKIKATGFAPRNWQTALNAYLTELVNE